MLGAGLDSTGATAKLHWAWPCWSLKALLPIRFYAMPELTARFTLTGDDYEAYLHHFYRHTRAGRRHMRRLYAVGWALFLLFVGMEYDHPKFGAAHPAYFAAYLILSAALMGGAYWYVIKRLWPSIAQGAVRRSRQKGMFTDTAVTVREEGLAIKTPMGEGSLDWTHVTEVAENDRYILLFTGGVNAFIIPRRGFADEKSAEAAAAAIRGLVHGARSPAS